MSENDAQDVSPWERIEELEERITALEAENRMKTRLLARCRTELLGILGAIWRDSIPIDGDDFHELLRDLAAAAEREEKP